MSFSHATTGGFSRSGIMGGWRETFLKETGSRAAIISSVPLAITVLAILGKGRQHDGHMGIVIPVTVFCVACIILQSYLCATLILNKYDLLPLIDAGMMVEPDEEGYLRSYHAVWLTSAVGAQYRDGFHGRYMRHEYCHLRAGIRGRARTGMEMVSHMVNNGRMTVIENHADYGTERIRTVRPAAGHGEIVRILDMIDES